MSGIYGRAARTYLRAGWSCPLPLPERAKEAPPAGYTGRGARLVGVKDLEQWTRRFGDGNIALRCVGPMIGIDVDAYTPKVGGRTLARAEAELGELPPTWVSTARLADGSGSGIRWYRLPSGVVLGAEAEAAIAERFGEDVGGKWCSHVEIIRPDHRYALVWPSVHPDTLATYRWITPDGEVLDEDQVPAVAEIPELGGSWLVFLAGTMAGRVGPESGPVRPAPSSRAQRAQPVGETVDEPVDSGADPFEPDEFETPGRSEQSFSAAEARMKIEGGLAAVAAAPRGTINDTLNREAFYLFHFTPAFIGERELAGRLVAAQTKAWVAGGGVDDGNVRAAQKTIRSAHGRATAPDQWRAVLADDDDEEVDPLAAIAGIEGVDVEPGEDEKGSTKVSGLFFTEARFSELVADTLRPRVRYTRELGWMFWHKRGVWVRTDEDVPTEAIRRWVLERARVAGRKLAKAQDADEDHAVPASEIKRLEGLVEGWRSYTSASKISAVVRLARGQIRAEADDFDTHRDLLNTPTGIVDLRTGDLHPHDPELMMTKMTRAPWRGLGHVHELWDKAVTAIPDDVRDWVQMFMGQGCTGYRNTEGRMLLIDGDGANGKGVLTNEGAVHTLGDYAVVLSENLLMANSGQHPTEKMALRGARMTLIDETPEARRLDTQRLKKLLDQPVLAGARYLYKEEMRVELVNTLVVATNYVPQVTEFDHGTWRRLARLRMPYTYRKPSEELTSENDRRGDPHLKAGLEFDAEVQAACLAWLVAGAMKWYAAGRQQEDVAARIVADTRGWRAEGDLIMNFTDEFLVIEEGRHVIASELLEEFNRYLETQGNRPWSAKVLGTRLAQHEVGKTRGVERRRGYVPGTRGEAPPSRPPSRWRRGDLATPGQYAAWFGLAWRGEPRRTQEVPIVAQRGTGDVLAGSGTDGADDGADPFTTASQLTPTD